MDCCEVCRADEGGRMSESNICYCGAYGGGVHTLSARCPKPVTSIAEPTHAPLDEEKKDAYEPMPSPRFKVFGPFALRVDANGNILTNSVGDPLIFLPAHRPSDCVAADIVVPEPGGPSIDIELRRLKIRDKNGTAHLNKLTGALRELGRALGVPDVPTNEVELIELATRMFKEQRDAIVRLKSLNVDAEIGKPYSVSATFDGEGVKAFAAHLVEWFRAQKGDNFVTIDMTDPVTKEKFELTMQRVGGKSPAQVLGELRRELEELRGTPMEPIDELMKKLPHVRSDMPAELAKESHAQLVRRVLIQNDWLQSHAKVLDELPMRIGGSGVDSCRMPREIRLIVETLRGLLKDIYDADRGAIEEMKAAGVVVDDLIDPKFQHRIEDALGLPSTRKEKKS